MVCLLLWQEASTRIRKAQQEKEVRSFNTVQSYSHSTVGQFTCEQAKNAIWTKEKLSTDRG